MAWCLVTQRDKFTFILHLFLNFAFRVVRVSVLKLGQSDPIYRVFFFSFLQVWVGNVTGMGKVRNM